MGEGRAVFTDAGHAYGLGSVMVVEVLFTALLVVVVLSMSGPRVSAGLGAVIAGLTLALIHVVTMPVDNTGVNPIRSLGTAIFSDVDPDALVQLWAFIVFPLVGAVIGVVVWLLATRPANASNRCVGSSSRAIGA